MRSLLLLLLLPSLLLASTKPNWATADDPLKDSRTRFRTNEPYTLCPVGSLVDWRQRRVASLPHATVKNDTDKPHLLPKAYDLPFSTVEYGRTCVMTLGFTARESRPILAYVGTEIPPVLETTLTGFYRLTRDTRLLTTSKRVPDMAVFYSKEHMRFGNCNLFKEAQHIRFTSETGLYFVVCYGKFERLIDADTKKNIAMAGDEVLKKFVEGGKAHDMGLKWSYKKQDLYFLDADRIQNRMKHVMKQMHDKLGFYVNPTEFEGWSETVMPHFDLRTVIYEAQYKKVRTEAHSRNTIRYILGTCLNILQCILMEKFYLLLRKYLL